MDGRLKSAIEAADRDAVVALLEEEPGLAGERDGALSAVMLAAYYKQPEIAGTLLEVRGPADLFEAAALGLCDRVRALVCWDPRAIAERSPDGFTPLHLAAYFSNADTVRCLLEAGAYVESVAENVSRVRPLHSGVAGGCLDVVEALLEAGAEPDVRQEGGFTPLMGAAAGGSPEMVRALLGVGADAKALTDDGQSALDLAREHHHAHLEELLGN
ncbi:MAG: ankyrin repeat domain-containing protein [Gemmatimonadota bacterium]|nr:ankyrin repeat domain-containing protein [Gemmatimonadota bacterium]MDH3422648.1 ankyrin repeat domain-containing protein [Gemmatimonadota bacterium]